VYPQGLVDEGSEGAGLRGRDDEYAFLPTSEWTEMVADLYGRLCTCIAGQCPNGPV